MKSASALPSVVLVVGLVLALREVEAVAAVLVLLESLLMLE